MPRLYVVGSANMDLVVRAPSLPGAGETVIGSDLAQIPGGKGANQAVAAARLGAAVSFVGAVGDDAFGATLRQALAADGVDVANLTSLPGRPSGVALIVVDDTGENAIAVGTGANAAVTPQHVDVAMTSIGPDDVLLVQLEIPLDTVAHACRVAGARGARAIVNAAPAHPRTGDLLAAVSALIVNELEAAALVGADNPDPASVARALGELGPEIAIVTLGGEGLVISEHGTPPLHLPAQQVEVVDTTAAGDAFCGAFAAALLTRQPAPEAARFASVAAALATTRLGAQSSLPTRADIDAFLRQTRPGQLESRT
jgi:ribokinase